MEKLSSLCEDPEGSAKNNRIQNEKRMDFVTKLQPTNQCERPDMNPRRELPDDLFIAYGEEIEQVLRRAVHQALRMHKRAGNPVAGWKDGKVVIIPAEEIPVDDWPESGPA
jgi:hypothetical protein